MSYVVHIIVHIIFFRWYILCVHTMFWVGNCAYTEESIIFTNLSGNFEKAYINSLVLISSSNMITGSFCLLLPFKPIILYTRKKQRESTVRSNQISLYATLNTWLHWLDWLINKCVCEREREMSYWRGQGGVKYGPWEWWLGGGNRGSPPLEIEQVKQEKKNYGEENWNWEYKCLVKLNLNWFRVQVRRAWNLRITHYDLISSSSQNLLLTKASLSLYVKR